MTTFETRDQTPLSQKVVAEVARQEDVPPTELDALGRVVEPGALDKLFRPVQSATRQFGRVSFPYNGYKITVHADGRIDVLQRDEGSRD